MDQNDRLQQLKEEYLSAMPPEYGYAQLEETIQRAKREKRRAGIRRLCAWGISAAAVLCLSVIAFRFAYVRMQSDEADNAALTEVAVTTDAETSADAEIEAYSGVVEGTEDNNVLQNTMAPKLPFEKASAQIADTGEDVYLEQAAWLFEQELWEQGIDYSELYAFYVVRTDTSEWLTLILYVTDMQLEEVQYERYYNIDKTTGEVVSLKEMFSEDTDYVELLGEEIRRQLAEADGAASEETADAALQIAENQNYYLNESGNLVIVLETPGLDPDENTEIAIPEDVFAARYIGE